MFVMLPYKSQNVQHATPYGPFTFIGVCKKYHQGKELGGGVGVELYDYTPENLCDTEQFIHIGSITSCCLRK